MGKVISRESKRKDTGDFIRVHCSEYCSLRSKALFSFQCCVAPLSMLIAPLSTNNLFPIAFIV